METHFYLETGTSPVESTIRLDVVLTCVLRLAIVDQGLTETYVELRKHSNSHTIDVIKSLLLASAQVRGPSCDAFGSL